MAWVASFRDSQARSSCATAPENLSISANGAFTFLTGVAEGATYAVSVVTQPVNQVCSVANGTGTMQAANVSNVTVTCVTGTPPPPTSFSIAAP